MDRKEKKIKERLELALRLEKPPTLEEVLEQVSTRSVLRGPVDWVFPAWIIYVEYAMQKIAETFPLSEEEKQWFHFRDALTRLLRGGVDADERKAYNAVQGRRRGHVQVRGEEAVRAGRDVDVCKRETYSAYYDPRRGRLGAFSRRVEASARET
jgi:hypothetical protein